MVTCFVFSIKKIIIIDHVNQIVITEAGKEKIFILLLE